MFSIYSTVEGLHLDIEAVGNRADNRHVDIRGHK